MSAAVERAREEIADHLAEIAAMFQPGAKLTLLARQPSHLDGSRDMVVTNDRLLPVLTALEIRAGVPRQGAVRATLREILTRTAEVGPLGATRVLIHADEWETLRAFVFGTDDAAAPQEAAR